MNKLGVRLKAYVAGYSFVAVNGPAETIRVKIVTVQHHGSERLQWRSKCKR
jgi:hypothetical protein